MNSGGKLQDHPSFAKLLSASVAQEGILGPGTDTRVVSLMTRDFMSDL